MRIALVISSLGSGGAERAMTGIANFWARKGHHITLITHSGESEDFYRLDSKVVRIRMNYTSCSASSNPLIRVFQRWYKLRKILHDVSPNAVLSFMDKTNVLTLLACIGLQFRVVVAERTNPEHYPIPWVWSKLRDKIYRCADILVVQTEALRTWASERTTNSRVRVIPNALDQERLAILSNTSSVRKAPGEGRIVAVGRMTREKGHDLLLTACAIVLQEFPNWKLDLIGDGPLRQTLSQQARELGIENQIVFHGSLANPFEYMKSSDIFVLPSRLEGFPNVLLEALALNCACISFDCPYGPSDLIKNEVNGLLVSREDPIRLAVAIRRLITDPGLRKKLATYGPFILNRYTEEKIMLQWNEAVGI